MLDDHAIEVGLRRFAVELRDREREFASEVQRIRTDANDRGMLDSSATVDQIRDAIRREYEARALLLWHIIRDLVDLRRVNDVPESRSQLGQLVEQRLLEAETDLMAAWPTDVVQKGGFRRLTTPILGARQEALEKVDSEIDVELQKANLSASRSTGKGASGQYPTPAGDITVFLGASSASGSQARAVVEALRRPGLTFLPWWDAFPPGGVLLQELDAIRERVSGALFLMSPESTATIRGKEVAIPNLNVLFEFGYFYGHFGKRRVGLLKYGDFYLPTDFGGYIHITGSKSFKRGKAVKVGARTTKEFDRWAAGL